MSAAKKNLGGAYVPPGNLKSESSLTNFSDDY